MADRFIFGITPIDYNPVVLRKPFRPHLTVSALPCPIYLGPGEALLPPLDIDPGPRVEWDFNPPETCAARHTIRDSPPLLYASILSPFVGPPFIGFSLGFIQ